MSYYVHGSGISYRQYLQAKSFVDDIRWDISQGTLATLATGEQLREIGIGVERSNDTLARIDAGIAASTERMEQGFMTLHADLGRIESSVRELSALFEWHMSELSMQVGHMADTLDALLEIAKTPEQTWAFEQYEMARSALRRKLIPEAMEFVGKAINGHAGHTGNKIEHRFHHLLGTIFLAGDRGADEYCDPGKAEQAFAQAARCARVDYPGDAAAALSAAGYAAYCQGGIERAVGLLEQALRLDAKSGEARYLHAKLMIHSGRVREGLASLRQAIFLDALYALKCYDDADFLKHEDRINGLIGELKSEMVPASAIPAGYADLLRRLKRDCETIGPIAMKAYPGYGWEGVGSKVATDYRAGAYYIEQILQVLDQVDQHRASGTFLGIVSAAHLARLADPTMEGPQTRLNSSIMRDVPRIVLPDHIGSLIETLLNSARGIAQGFSEKFTLRERMGMQTERTRYVASLKELCGTAQQLTAVAGPIGVSRDRLPKLHSTQAVRIVSRPS